MQIKNIFGRRIAFIALVSLAGIFAGCKAEPAPNSGFLAKPQLMKSIDRLPFDRTYLDPKFSVKNYDKIMVAPVNLDYLMPQNLWEQASVVNLSGEVEEEIFQVGQYTHQAFVEAARNDPRRHFRVVYESGPRTLVLETALTQLVPSKSLLNAAELVFWEAYVVAFAGQAAFQSEAGSSGVVAIEGVLRDAQTGQIVAMFADRERPKDAIINFRALAWWEPNRRVIDDWAAQLIEVLNAPPGQTVERSGHFALLLF
ncbi:MAG: DUF3313 domain-containing protein [Planctomycetota bacterium]|nr:DUF3313 domain-containing protein [Planctomycetota bacterium]